MIKHALTEPGSNANNTIDPRRVPRFPFVATTEITQVSSGARLQVSTRELSLYGCYIDMHHPLPCGTQVVVRIFTATDYFEAPATVAYSHPRLGIGVAFHHVKKRFLPIWGKWLREATQRAMKVSRAI